MIDQSRCDDGSGLTGQGRRALVVFEDRADSKSLRLLRPGFRHCFCLVGARSTWTICDPLKTRIELTSISGVSERELVARLAGVGRTVLSGDVSPDRSPRAVRLRAISCVEVVKRVLNIAATRVLTPFQLYRALVHLSWPSRPFVVHSAGQIYVDSGHK